MAFSWCSTLISSIVIIMTTNGKTTTEKIPLSRAKQSARDTDTIAGQMLCVASNKAPVLETLNAAAMRNKPGVFQFPAQLIKSAAPATTETKASAAVSVRFSIAAA
jgi:hypothetical protein